MAMSVTYTNFCGRIIAENRGGVQRAYQRDTLGNTVALLDNTQTSTDTWEYWPFGEVVNRTGSNPTPFGFVGTLGYYTGILGMLYVRARVYMASLGRWLTVDPLWSRLPAYEYAENSPIRNADPLGLLTLTCEELRDICLEEASDANYKCQMIASKIYKAAQAACRLLPKPLQAACFATAFAAWKASAAACTLAADQLYVDCGIAYESCVNAQTIATLCVEVGVIIAAFCAICPVCCGAVLAA